MTTSLEFKNAVTATTQELHQQIKRQTEEFKTTFQKQIADESRTQLRQLTMQVEQYQQQLEVSETQLEKYKNVVNEVESEKIQLTKSK